jgi:signal transduction histidine kinase
MIVNKVLAPHRQSITHLEIRGSKVQERFIRKQNKTYIRVWSPLRSQGWVIVFDISVESVFKKIAKAQKFIFLYVILAGGIIFIFGYLGLRRLVLNPLSSLARAIDKVRKGDISVEIETQKSKELFILSQGFNQMTSALRNRERELKEAHNQLIRTEKLASLGRLSAGIAHEIGNPTTAILGFLEMLSDNISEKERQDFLRRIRTETERINKIVRQLLEYSRPPTEEIGPVSVKKIIEETVDLVRVQKKFKDIKIKTIIPEDIPLVIGNSSKMVQVFLNLFFNSRDAMQGKGEIKVEVQEVQDQVNIQVIDTGPGIPPPILSEIFEPFFSTKNSGQGTGLGLAICQSIIEGFEGKISAKNSPQGGAIISIILKKSP